MPKIILYLSSNLVQHKPYGVYNMRQLLGKLDIRQVIQMLNRLHVRGKRTIFNSTKSKKTLWFTSLTKSISIILASFFKNEVKMHMCRDTWVKKLQSTPKRYLCKLDS